MYTIWYMDKNKKKNNRKIVRKKFKNTLKLRELKEQLFQE